MENASEWKGEVWKPEVPNFGKKDNIRRQKNLSRLTKGDGSRFTYRKKNLHVKKNKHRKYLLVSRKKNEGGRNLEE